VATLSGVAPSAMTGLTADVWDLAAGTVISSNTAVKAS
jgi:hypothetical protein